MFVAGRNRRLKNDLNKASFVAENIKIRKTELKKGSLSVGEHIKSAFNGPDGQQDLMDNRNLMDDFSLGLSPLGLSPGL